MHAYSRRRLLPMKLCTCRESLSATPQVARSEIRSLSVGGNRRGGTSGGQLPETAWQNSTNWVARFEHAHHARGTGWGKMITSLDGSLRQPLLAPVCITPLPAPTGPISPTHPTHLQLPVKAAPSTPHRIQVWLCRGGGRSLPQALPCNAPEERVALQVIQVECTCSACVCGKGGRGVLMFMRDLLLVTSLDLTRLDIS
jgi:hypothetical protein